MLGVDEQKAIELELSRLEPVDYAVRLTPQWLAGFFDGEGCVSSAIGPSGAVNIAVSLPQKKPEVLSLIAMRFPAEVRLCRASKGLSRYYHQIDYIANSAIPLLEYIKEHVIVKRDQVILGLKLARLCAPKNEGWRKLTPEEKEERLKLHYCLKVLKHGFIPATLE